MINKTNLNPETRNRFLFVYQKVVKRFKEEFKKKKYIDAGVLANSLKTWHKQIFGFILMISIRIVWDQHVG